VLLPLHTGKLRQLAVFFYEEQVYDICVSNLLNSNILSLKKKIKTCFPILLLLPHSSKFEVCKNLLRADDVGPCFCTYEIWLTLLHWENKHV